MQKGSVAIDGISLTVADVTEKKFAVSLIPTTIGLTTLGTKNIGDSVNIECDIIGKYIEKFVIGQGGKTILSMDFLKDNGFV